MDPQLGANWWSCEERQAVGVGVRILELSPASVPSRGSPESPPNNLVRMELIIVFYRWKN